MVSNVSMYGISNKSHQKLNQNTESMGNITHEGPTPQEVIAYTNICFKDI